MPPDSTGTKGDSKSRASSEQVESEKKFCLYNGREGCMLEFQKGLDQKAAC